MERNPELSLRVAPATSFFRAYSFNKSHVYPLYDNLTIVMDRHEFEPQDIYNADETAMTTVVKFHRVMARRRSKLVTVVVAARNEPVGSAGIILEVEKSDRP